jgi:hypothetical protein
MIKEMKTYTLLLSESQLASLKVFMERTELNGREVHKFVELVQIINESENQDAKSSKGEDTKKILK